MQIGDRVKFKKKPLMFEVNQGRIYDIDLDKTYTIEDIKETSTGSWVTLKETGLNKYCVKPQFGIWTFKDVV